MHLNLVSGSVYSEIKTEFRRPNSVFENMFNGKFDPKKDKIGFYKQFISVPNDTVYELELFKENLPFKAFIFSLLQT
jgi:hypothetical protein